MASLRPPAFLDLNNLSLRPTARWQMGVLAVLALVVAGGIGALGALVNPLAAIAVAALPLALVLVIVTVPRQNLYPYVILLLALFMPFSLPTGRDSRLVLSLVFTMLAFALIVVRSLVVERRWPLKPSAVTLPTLLWMVAVLISWGWSIAFRDYGLWTWPSFPMVQAASAVVMIMLPAAMLMVGHLLNTERELKWLVGLMLFAAILALVHRYSLVSLPININGLFNMWIVALAGGMALFNRKLALPLRGLIGLLMVAYALWGILFRVQWLAGWLSCLAVLAVMIMMHSARATVLLSIAGLALAALSLTSIDTVIEAENAESGGTRLAAWAVNWSITRDHLLFGTGPAGYAAYYMTYLPTEAMATHSNYIDIFSQTGIVGSVLYLWMFAAVIVLGFRLCRRLRGRGDFLEALAQAAFAGTLGCMVMMAFGDWLIPFAYTQTIAGYDYAVYNWIFMGTLIVVDRLTQGVEGRQGAADDRLALQPAHE